MYRMIGADGREYGPISAEQLRQWIAQGRANATTNVLAEGAAEWKPLGSLPEFSMLFAGPTSAAASAPTPNPVTPAAFPYSTVTQRKTNGLAVAALVMGILSITLGLCCCDGLPFSIPGIVFGIIALGQIKAQPERYDGRTMAIISIVLCGISLLIAAVLLLFGITSALWDSSSRHGHRL